MRGRSSDRTLTGWSAHLNEILPVRNADRTGPGGHLSRPATRDVALEAALLRRSAAGKLARTMGDRRDFYYTGVPVSSRSI